MDAFKWNSRLIMADLDLDLQTCELILKQHNSFESIVFSGRFGTDINLYILLCFFVSHISQMYNSGKTYDAGGVVDVLSRSKDNAYEAYQNPN